MIYKQEKEFPYILVKGKRKTVFNIKNTPGVYMIYKGKKLLYVGFSGSNLYKTMYRHFQSWNDPTQIRVTYDPFKIKVCVIYTETAEEADILEKALILKYKPKDNPILYKGFEADKDEKKIFKIFTNEQENPVVNYAGDLPF
jgi:excinuclease UvrABC nuclease subunit